MFGWFDCLQLCLFVLLFACLLVLFVPDEGCAESDEGCADEGWFQCLRGWC